MRYSVTLKNAFNRLVNTAEGKTKRPQRCTLGIGLAPEKWKNGPHAPPGPTLLVVGVRHETHLNRTGVVQQFVQFSRCSCLSYCFVVSDPLSR